MTVLAMGAAEITRFDTLMRLDRGEIRVADAMELLGLARRQVYRLLGRLREDGAGGLVSRKRGRPSNRRDCHGELIQVDGSKHWWFEGRGPQCTLLVFIDDATSELMHVEMVESESTFSYMRATRTYLERHGKPVAFYTDKHSAFRNNTASAKGDGMIHLDRALDRLNIELICANSPQAKGRVERVNATLQDRLVKAMRLQRISTIDQANAFLPSYMAQHNRRFAKAPFDPRDLHRPLAIHEDLEAELVWREQRTVTGALTLHYNKAMFILEPSSAAQALARKKGGRVRVPGRPARDPARGHGPTLSYVRQDAPGEPGCRGRQQAPRRGAGARPRDTAGSATSRQAQQQRAGALRTARWPVQGPFPVPIRPKAGSPYAR
ncbi:hypothetical protein FHY03_003713 [Sphingomonas sp. BK345]|nr:ISNCY family transposase [Sphingomonas sp. BK345]MBB3475408.1 hypothetical protein [Sphingomonas sp. BK345]